MFRGTTIEELISSVCRAEERARQQQRQAAISAIGEQQPQQQELIEVG